MCLKASLTYNWLKPTQLLYRNKKNDALIKVYRLEYYNVTGSEKRRHCAIPKFSSEVITAIDMSLGMIILPSCYAHKPFLFQSISGIWDRGKGVGEACQLHLKITIKFMPIFCDSQLGTEDLLSTCL